MMLIEFETENQPDSSKQTCPVTNNSRRNKGVPATEDPQHTNVRSIATFGKYPCKLSKNVR